MKMIPQIAYAAIGEANYQITDANYINASKDETYAIRYIEIDGKNYYLISGLSHDANQFKNPFEEMNKLMAFGKNKLGITDYYYAWTGQDYKAIDTFPYIGKVKEDIYIASCFNKWGISQSSAGAILIKDLIIKGTSKFEEAFNPKRIKINNKFISYNLKMVKTIAKTKIFPQGKNLTLSTNTGKVVKINGKLLGIYKDEEEKLYIVKASCPHMGCGLRFNPIDRTYDCKCHGSRFTYTGKKIDGPAKFDLEKLEESLILSE